MAWGPCFKGMESTLYKCWTWLWQSSNLQLSSRRIAGIDRNDIGKDILRPGIRVIDERQFTLVVAIAAPLSQQDRPSEIGG